MSAVEKLLIKLDTVYDVLTSTTKIGQVTDLPLESIGKLKLEDLDVKDNLSLQVKNLKFKMIEHHSYVLNNINFEIKNGERVGIYGLNEMEKIMLVNTIMGVYRQYEGVIAFNHVSLRDISKRSMYDLITTNSQEKIFDGTILDNISLGRTNISLQTVLWATKLVKVNDFILSHPDGLHANLTGGSTWITKSNTEKLILARSIVQKPKLIVLEDFLPSVEKKERLEIFEALLSKDFPWTIMVIINDQDFLSKCERTLDLSQERLIAQ